MKDKRNNPLRRKESSLPYIILRQWIDLVKSTPTEAELKARKHLYNIYSMVGLDRIRRLK